MKTNGNTTNLPVRQTGNEKDFYDDVSGDLGIPGSELDEIQDYTGSENEENSYYNLGGDDFYYLEEE